MSDYAEYLYYKLRQDLKELEERVDLLENENKKLKKVINYYLNGDEWLAKKELGIIPHD